MDRADPLPDDHVCATVPADAAAVVSECDVDHIHSLNEDFITIIKMSQCRGNHRSWQEPTGDAGTSLRNAPKSSGKSAQASQDSQ